MAATDSSTINFPPDLIEAAREFAATTHQSVDIVAQKALRSYIDADQAIESIRQSHRERAAALGLTSEEYVERMVHEYRTEERSKSA